MRPKVRSMTELENFIMMVLWMITLNEVAWIVNVNSGASVVVVVVMVMVLLLLLIREWFWLIFIL